MSKVNVTKTFLPPLEEYVDKLKTVWDTGQLTNQGPMLKELEYRLSNYLNVENISYVANGTLALQLALRTLNYDDGEIITTPFSYVASTSSILWEKYTPVFVDIERDTLCIDPLKIEAAITERTRAILAVHVYGNACNIEEIECIATQNNLKIIYDGAHCFGADYKERSLLNYGDITTCSFHATKLFHTVEGGCIVSNNDEVHEALDLMKRFGHNGDDHLILGINAKNSELHAAMGICNLKYVSNIIVDRKRASDLYDEYLPSSISTVKYRQGLKRNYAYYPVIFKNEKSMQEATLRLNMHDIFPRRYFYPSLDQLPYVNSATACDISRDVSKRVLCLPLYYGIGDDQIKNICSYLKDK